MYELKHPKLKEAWNENADYKVLDNLENLLKDPTTSQEVIDELAEIMKDTPMEEEALQHPNASESAKRRYLMRKYS